MAATLENPPLKCDIVSLSSRCHNDDDLGPLAPRDRDKFLRVISAIIVALPERGDGAVHRAIRSVWREYYDAPDLHPSVLDCRPAPPQDFEHSARRAQAD